MQESKQVGMTKINKVTCVHKKGNTFGKGKRKGKGKGRQGEKKRNEKKRHEKKRKELSFRLPKQI